MFTDCISLPRLKHRTEHEIAQLNLYDILGITLDYALDWRPTLPTSYLIVGDDLYDFSSFCIAGCDGVSDNSICNISPPVL